MTTPSQKQIALADLEQEIATTRRALERVPDEHLGWKPHEKSMTLGELATHLSVIPFYGVATLRADELNVAGLPPTQIAASRDELLIHFDENVKNFRAILYTADDDAIHRPWTLRSGEHVVFTLPRVAVLRRLLVNHMIHHRGQLSVYLRLLDVPVPSMYGPTADEGGF